MAFPGTYNIRYYQGDLYEFNIYPKTTNGSAFDLTGYSVKFFIATARGTGATQYECVATISNGAISCLIPGGIGKTLVAGTTYVYDVQIKKSVAGSADKIYTLLTGDITVRADVTRMSGD
jgi:hypothetical protein